MSLAVPSPLPTLRHSSCRLLPGLSSCCVVSGPNLFFHFIPHMVSSQPSQSRDSIRLLPRTLISLALQSLAQVQRPCRGMSGSNTLVTSSGSPNSLISFILASLTFPELILYFSILFVSSYYPLAITSHVPSPVSKCSNPPDPSKPRSSCVSPDRPDGRFPSRRACITAAVLASPNALACGV